MTEAELEKLVKERKLLKFSTEVRAYAKKHRDPDDRIQISDWYRRLGKFADALKILTQFESVPSGASTDTPEGRIRLQTAHILNQGGASFSALQIVNKLELKRANDFRIAGMIALDNFEFKLALRHLEKFHKLDTERASYRSRLTEMTRADALSDVGKTEDAISVLKSISIQEGEELLDAIRSEVMGEVLASAKRFPESLEALRDSEKKMPKDESTADSAVLWKWLGYVLGKLGDEKAALRYFDRAEPILRAPTLRIEAYFHFLVMKASVLLEKPEVVQRILYYPGLAPGFNEVMRRFVTLEDVRESKERLFGKKAARIQIYLQSGEFKVDEQWHLGLPLELKLAAHLRVAEAWGVSLARAKSTFWPEEVYQFFSLDGRIHSFITRLKSRYHLRCKIDQGVIRLEAKSWPDVSVVFGETLPSFFQKRASFHREDFENYYAVSATQAKTTIALWLAQGKIVKEGRGPSSFYRIVKGEA